MKLKVTYRFFDLEERVTRGVGEEFDASPERAEKLVSRGLAEVVENPAELAETPETGAEEAVKKAEKPKKPRKKKENN
ncbi:MAG: hypothetical protein IJ899_00480 [Blautia sp.]|nr:hypothetical protein [Blautia sp.]